MSEADINADMLPHWKCECGFRVFTPQLDLEEQVCFCGKGAGRWHVENGHLLAWMEGIDKATERKNA